MQATVLFAHLCGGAELEPVLAGDCEFLATVTTARCKHAAAIGSGHTLAEAVFVATLADRRLECAFHIGYFLLFFS